MRKIKWPSGNKHLVGNIVMSYQEYSLIKTRKQLNTMINDKVQQAVCTMRTLLLPRRKV